MAFDSGVVVEDWRSAVIIPLYKGKGEWTECKIYSLLSIVGKIYAGILVNGVYILTGGFIDDEHVGFRAAKGIVDQIFTQR